MTSIGSFAFSECVNLASVTIPDGVTTIGEHAFDVCRSLTSITIPDSVTTIGPGAFSGCWGLTSISIPKGVTSIGNMAFYCCLNLTSVTIPDSVTSIGAQAFYECSSLTSVTIPKGVTRLESEIFCNCANLASVTLPKGLAAIGDSAFSSCSKLRDVYFGGTEAEKESLTIGSDNACLTNAQWHYAPAIVDSGTCGKNGDNLTWTLDEEGTLTISGTGEMKNLSWSSTGWLWQGDSVKSVVIEEGITSIGSWAFDGCSSLTSVSIPDGMTSIGSMAFYGCSSLTSVKIPDGVTNIGSSCFLDCSGLTSISIPESVTSIDDSTFQDCSSLISISIPEGVTSIGKLAFSDCSSLTSISIPEGVTSIGNTAFSNCSSLTSISIPEGVTSIGSYAFSSCSSLTSIIIPESVTSIGSYAFSSCSAKRYASIGQDGAKALSKAGYSFRVPNNNCDLMYLFDGDTVTDIEVSGADKDAVSITIPEGVTSIGGSAFSGCSSLTGITIPEGVTSIGGSAFSGCSAILYANMDSEGAKALSKVGYSFRVPETNYDLKYLYDNSTVTGIAILNVDKDVVTVTIPEGVTSIGSSAFSGCSSLTGISIPKSVTSINYRAFYNCSSLTGISIPDGVINVGGSAFSGCSAKRYANMDSDGARALGEAGYSFRVPETNFDLKYLYDDSTVTGMEISNVDKDAVSVKIPESVTSIGYKAFYNCSNLTGISIPDGVTSIDDYAFSYCSAKRYANMDSEGAKALSEAGYSFRVPEINYDLIYLYKNATIVGLEIESADEDAVSVNILEGVTSIGRYAFEGCGKLTSVTIPEGVTNISEGAFNGCGNLATVIIPSTVTSIGKNAFYECSSLERVSIPESVTIIGTWAFYGCSSLRSVSIPENMTSIPDDVFYKCSSLERVTIPQGVTSIGKWAFGWCESLAHVTIPESVTNIGDHAFYNCDRLISVTIPEGVTNIGESAFANSDSLSKILLPKSIESIGSSAIPRKTTIYCYAYTNADDWATENEYEHIVYIDGELDDLCVVTLPCDTLRLPIGGAKRVIADVFPAVKPGNIVWTSSDPAVASVEDGLITALAPGAATITATAGKAAASVEVTVYTRATGFAIPEEVWFVAKESVTLPVTDIQPEGADLVLTWSSGDASLVQVDENGTVTSNRPDNDIIITATTDDGISRQCVAHVYYPVIAVEFSQTQLTLGKDSTVQLTANVTAKTRSVVNKLVTFTSADEAVAKVDENGNVTAMGPGTTTITATAASGVSDSITVTVQGTLSLLRLPEGLEVIEDEAFMNLACEAIIIPEGCTTIGARAFANCEELVYVRIPASVQTIAEDAFEGCDKVVIDRAD